MSNIKINRIGTISQGDNVGWQVKIVPDSQGLDSYLILISKDFALIKSEGYDDWVSNYSELEMYFKESNWIITWQ